MPDVVGLVVLSLDLCHWPPKVWQPPGCAVLMPAEAWVPAPSLVTRTPLLAPAPAASSDLDHAALDTSTCLPVF